MFSLFVSHMCIALIILQANAEPTKKVTALYLKGGKEDYL